MVYLYETNFGGCLADDMGLGKTIQTIALLQHIALLQKPLEGAGNYISNSVSEKNTQLSIFDMQAEEEEECNPPLPSLIVMPTSLIHNWHNELNRFAPKLKVYIYSGPKRPRSKDVYKIFRHYHVILTTYGTVRTILKCCKMYVSPF
jgi:SNF2 family DNA or RNA helicase